MHPFLRILPLLLALLLVACGYKGPLVKPTPAGAGDAPAAAGT